MSADRNLLFGILAAQLDFVSRDELMAGMNAWLMDKARPLGAVLRDLGHLSPGRLQLLDALVAEHLKRHGDDPRRSLAALSSVADALRESLAAVPDTDVQQTLQQIPAPAPQTLPHQSGSRPPHGAAAPGGVRYRILRPHARGGLGEVYVAEDTELGRQVALKEIQGRWADHDESRTRFVREAEITGGLEHPGVVPVYGLGTYSDGRPFYAMRFIQGDNLHDAIKRFHNSDAGTERQLPAGPPAAAAPGRPGFDSLAFRQLLQRFVDVCNAVAYAHSRGVLHRDLKPGNVMLGKYGETLVVDWGLAKAIGRAAGDGGRGGDATLVPRSDDSAATAAGQAMGTPAYMSPEQAEGRLDDLGPATDVYALGATLYELLTGRASVQAPTLGETLERVRTGRIDRPRAVVPAVPRPLEAVCLRAMALAPADRYPSALDVAKDVERWLADEPVSAYREPAAARLRRWVRKHARLVTALAAALAVGVGALGLLAWQKERARRAVEAESKEKAIALARVEKFNEILGSIFEDLDPRTAEQEGKPLQAVLGERLDAATAAIEGEATGDALAVARMQLTLGDSQLALGHPAKAIRLLTAARATFAARLGPDHADTLKAADNLAAAHHDSGKPDLAIPILEEALPVSRATRGADHPGTLTIMGNLAAAYDAAGRQGLARPLNEEVLRLKKAKLGPSHRDTLVSMNNLAALYRSDGKLDLALPLQEEAVRLMKANLGPDEPLTLSGMNNLALIHRAAGRLGASIPLYEETLRRRKAKLGPDHPDTLTSMNNLAQAYRAVGKADLALAIHEEAFPLNRAKLGPDHPSTLTAMNNLALGYHGAGQFDRALPLYQDALRLTRAKLGPDHRNTLLGMNNLAVCHRDAGQVDLALPMQEEAYRLMTATLGPDHPLTLAGMNNLAVVYDAAGRSAEALPLQEEAFRQRGAKFGPDHPDTLASMNNLAALCAAGGQADRAERLYREQADMLRRKPGPASGQYAAAAASLGLHLLTQKKWSDAEPVLRDCLAIRDKAEPGAWTTHATKALLGECLLGRRKYADAEPLLLAGFEGLERRADAIPKAGKFRVAAAAERLARLCDAHGKPDEAARWLDEMWAWADAPAPDPAKP